MFKTDRGDNMMRSYLLAAAVALCQLRKLRALKAIW